MENLLAAWREFHSGKKKREDVARFSLRLMDNISDLHDDLREKTYTHGPYQAFKINDPKPRDIHKATVRDRLLHHAIYRILYPFFDPTFIFGSYSCRQGKGTHRAMNRFRDFASKVSKNHTRTVWVLKCDIKRFFANIDHEILLGQVARYVKDNGVLWLLGQIVGSFSTGGKLGVGLPLGNLTSQLLVNIYMNAFDQFVKRELQARFYIRYADDFVLLHYDKAVLEELLPQMNTFLKTELRLLLHPRKVSLTTLASGVDFLGWVHFPHHRVLRTATRRRMLKRIRRGITKQSLCSYRGLLRHGNALRLEEDLNNV